MYQNPYFKFRQPALKMHHLRKALYCTKNYSMWYPMAETGDTGESIEHSARATPLKLDRLPVTQEAAGSSPVVPAIIIGARAT
jgi:hypothetical protein